jgi:hypothetical protein
VRQKLDQDNRSGWEQASLCNELEIIGLRKAGLPE